MCSVGKWERGWVCAYKRVVYTSGSGVDLYKGAWDLIQSQNNQTWLSMFGKRKCLLWLEKLIWCGDTIGYLTICTMRGMMCLLGKMGVWEWEIGSIDYKKLKSVVGLVGWLVGFVGVWLGCCMVGWWIKTPLPMPRSNQDQYRWIVMSHHHYYHPLITFVQMVTWKQRGG